MSETQNHIYAVEQFEIATARSFDHPEHPYSWAHVPSELMSLFTEKIDPETKQYFMTEAIVEARKSSLRPTVGAVIVKDNKIIGRGHRKVQKLRKDPPLWRVIHAEQAVLQSVAENVNGATLYVTIEPCAGRYEGPAVEAAEVCSVMIPRSGISTVVIGLVDRDPMTFGKGLKHLRKAGVWLEHAYHGLEFELVELIGDGRFDAPRFSILAAIRKWLTQ